MKYCHTLKNELKLKQLKRSLVYYSLSSTRPVFASLSPRAHHDATRQAHAHEAAPACSRNKRVSESRVMLASTMPNESGSPKATWQAHARKEAGA